MKHGQRGKGSDEEPRPLSHSLSRRATSGLMEAVFISGPITTCRYCWKPFPKILHIRAQAEIMYEI